MVYIKNINKIICLSLSICFLSVFNLNAQVLVSEIDKITMKKNISTPWRYTYEYLRNNSFRFRKNAMNSVTFDFRYRSPDYIFVDKTSSIVINFEDGTSVELYPIQDTVYMPYLTGSVKYYDIEVSYKLKDENDLKTIADKLIKSIRFNYRTPKDITYNEIIISKKRSESLKEIYSMFYETIQNE